jgi:uncharacterized protein YoxC
MAVTIDLKDALILVILVAVLILIIYLIRVAAKLVTTLSKTNELLDDGKRVSAVAADKTEQLDGILNEAGDAVLGITDALNGNISVVDKLSNIGLGVASVKDVASRLRTSDEQKYVDRAHERRAKKASK